MPAYATHAPLAPAYQFDPRAVGFNGTDPSFGVVPPPATAARSDFSGFVPDPVLPISAATVSQPGSSFAGPASPDFPALNPGYVLPHGHDVLGGGSALDWANPVLLFGGAPPLPAQAGYEVVWDRSGIPPLAPPNAPNAPDPEWFRRGFS